MNCNICNNIIIGKEFKCNSCGLIVCKKHYYNGKCLYCNNEYYENNLYGVY